ncbi:HD-GYP domain-containing protein [Rheinheimera pleomorphica]|uniref:HD-GYP domain-containing protein n=1 Tax=Rheinheimera pleomorphica TaxID=2703963 RepID=UPI0014208A89|nr:HD-GYP domain-containing protein [Rheinheimera pleomorphica]
MAYQEVSIADLQPGSYVVQVLRQSGEIIVKHAGWVRTTQAVELLRRKGVQVVLIDPDKTLQPDTSDTTLPVSPVVDDSSSRSLFNDEWPKAERALLQTQKVQRQLLEAVRHDSGIDLTLVYEVSAGLAESISRNQDVLLCLNRIAEQSDSLLQHSISCAVYMAAFARYLNLPPHKVQALITAALLHDIGKAVSPAYLQAEDHQAIPASLNTLQKTANLAGEISLWISQHCAHLDGSGSPRISAGQIEKGSRMLAIINSYEKLTSPLSSKLGPLAASRMLLQRTPHKLDAELLQQFIKCIGIYPPGSVVKLSSGKLALVLENNPKKPLLPKVKVFYHSVHQHHIPPRVLDLSRQQEEQIDSCIELKKYGLDVKNYI